MASDQVTLCEGCQGNMDPVIVILNNESKVRLICTKDNHTATVKRTLAGGVYTWCKCGATSQGYEVRIQPEDFTFGFEKYNLCCNKTAYVEAPKHLPQWKLDSLLYPILELPTLYAPRHNYIGGWFVNPAGQVVMICECWHK